jgi:hypothetical protein
MSSADVSARVAWADDAPAIAAVQVRAWRASYAELLPAEVLAALDPEQLAAGWREALARPADARQRTLVALERNTVTGFVLTGPSADPDRDPVATGELRQAAADTLVADRFTRAVTWLPARDDALRAFLTEAGWGPDGAHRTLDLLGDGAVTLQQVRLHTSFSD